MEYYYTLSSGELSNGVVAELDLGGVLYTKILIDNAVGAKGLVFKANNNYVEIAGDIEVSGKLLEFIAFTDAGIKKAQDNAIESKFKFMNFVVRGVSELRIISKIIDIKNGTAQAFDVKADRLFIDKLNLIDGVKLDVNKHVDIRYIYATALSGQAGNLIIGSNKISRVDVRVSGTSRIQSWAQVEVVNFTLSTNTFFDDGQLIGQNFNIDATDKIAINNLLANSTVNLASENLNITGQVYGKNIVTKIGWKIDIGKNASVNTDGNLKIETHYTSNNGVLNVGDLLYSSGIIGNYGALKAGAIECAKSFHTSKVMKITGAAKFNENISFGSYSVTSVGHLIVGSENNRVIEVSFKGASFVATSKTVGSSISAKVLSIEPAEFVKGEPIVDKGGNYWRCDKNHIVGYSCRYKSSQMHHNLQITDPNCNYSQRSEVIFSSDLILNIEEFKAELSLLEVAGQLSFYNKPTLSISTPNCSKYISNIYRYFSAASNFDSIIKSIGIQHYKLSEIKGCHWFGCFQTLTETDTQGLYKTIIKAREITGSLSSIDFGLIEKPAGGGAYLGGAGGQLAIRDLAKTEKNALQSLSNNVAANFLGGEVLIQFATQDANGKLITNKIDVKKFFKQSGLDINLFMDARQLNSKMWKLDPLPSKNALAGPGGASNQYELHYYVKGISKDDPNFNPKIFLDKLAFEGRGVVYTTDGPYTEKLIKDAVFITIGTMTGYAQNELVNLLSNNAHAFFAINKDLKPGQALGAAQIEKLKSPIIWPVWSSNCLGVIAKCLSYELYYNKEALDLFARGSMLIADERIDLKIAGDLILNQFNKITAGQHVKLEIDGNVVIIGKLEGANIDIAASGNFLAIDGIKSTADLVIKAQNILLAGYIESKGSITAEATDNIILATLKSLHQVSKNNHYESHDKVDKATKVSTQGTLSLKASNTKIIGVEIIGREVRIKSTEGVVIVPLELYDSVVSSGHRSYNEYRSLTYHQSKIITPSDKQKMISDGSYANTEIANSNGITGITIEAGESILLSGVNINSAKLKLKSGGDVKLETPEESKTIITSYTKKRGGLAGLCGGKKTITTKEGIYKPVASTIEAGKIEIESSKNILIGIDIIAYAVDLNKESITKSEMIKIMPKINRYSYEIETKKTGIMFEFSDSGHFMLGGTKKTNEGRANTQVIPTIIQLGGFSNDPADKPRFIGYTAGKFVMISSRIEEYTDTKGNVIAGRKAKIIIEAKDIELGSVPDTKFNFAMMSETGFGIGFKADLSEVAIKAGVFNYKNEQSTTKTEHKNPPTFLSQFLQLNATNSIRDVAAVYNAEQMDLHANIIFHGVAKDQIVTNTFKSLMEAGLKFGIKLGSLGRAINGAVQITNQDLGKVEGIINAASFSIEAYYEGLKALAGQSGISGGLFGFMAYDKESNQKTITQEIATNIKANKLLINAAQELTLLGTQVEAYSAYIKAKNVKSNAAEAKKEINSSSSSGDVDIPLTSPGAGIPSSSFGKTTASGNERIMFNARIHIHEDLRLEVTGHADLKGISLSAKSLEAFFNSLVLESVQNISKQGGNGVNLGFSPQDVSHVSGRINKSERHVVEEMTSILGKEKCHITVANALRLNGAMIAAAHRDENGNYSDHGALTLKVGELFIQHIYDYDNGYTLGAALSKSAVIPTVGGKSADGYTYGTVGKGDVNCGGKSVSGGTGTVTGAGATAGKYDINGGGAGVCGAGNLNRNLGTAKSWKEYYDMEPLRVYIPLEPLPTLKEKANNVVDETKKDIKDTDKPSVWDIIDEDLWDVADYKVEVLDEKSSTNFINELDKQLKAEREYKAKHGLNNNGAAEPSYVIEELLVGGGVGMKLVYGGAKKIISMVGKKAVEWVENRFGDQVIKFTNEARTDLLDILSKGATNDIVKSFDKHLKWKLDGDVINKVPGHLKKNPEIANSFQNPKTPRAGMKFEHKKGGNVVDSLRIMQRSEISEFASQGQDYVKIVSNGKVLGRDGLEVLKEAGGVNPSHKPEAHIPLKEWIKWKEWNKK